MKIVTLDGRVIFENKKAISKRELMVEALAYGITDFTEADLTGMDLQDLTFANCVFTKACFDKAYLQRTYFNTCHLVEATFRNCQTYHTRASLCNLDNCHFENTHMGYFIMDTCTLKDANFVDLGMTAKGYKVVMTYENGVALISGGCVQMTLDEAKDTYPETNNDEEGARVTLARRIAYQRGWLHKSAAVPIVIEPHDSICQGDPDPIGEAAVESLKEAIDKEVNQTVNA